MCCRRSAVQCVGGLPPLNIVGLQMQYRRLGGQFARMPQPGIALLEARERAAKLSGGSQNPSKYSVFRPVVPGWPFWAWPFLLGFGLLLELLLEFWLWLKFWLRCWPFVAQVLAHVLAPLLAVFGSSDGWAVGRVWLKQWLRRWPLVLVLAQR